MCQRVRQQNKYLNWLLLRIYGKSNLKIHAAKREIKGGILSTKLTKSETFVLHPTYKASETLQGSQVNSIIQTGFFLYC